MPQQAQCPKCGELNLSTKEVRTSRKKGKILNRFVNLGLGGLLLALGAFFVFGLLLVSIRGEFDMLWVFVVDALIFAVPGFFLVRAYVQGSDSPFFKCEKCGHKWTLHGETERQRRSAEKEELAARQVKCPKCNQSNFSTKVYFEDPGTGQRTLSASAEVSSSGWGVAKIVGGVVLCLLGIWFTGGLGLVSGALAIVLGLIFSGLGLIGAGIRTLIANYQKKGRKTIVEHTCNGCQTTWQDTPENTPA